MESKINRKIRSAAKKITLVEKHGGKCSCCDYSNKQLLHFHHVDPSTKKFSIGRNDFRMSRLEEEANKCILLCGNCHILTHCKDEVKMSTDRKRKMAMLQYLGVNSCSRCGISKSPSILEFHHTSNSNKEFTLNDYRGSHIDLSEDVKAELDKCEVICRNCHAEEHFDLEFHASVIESIKSYEIVENRLINPNTVLSLHDDGKSNKEISLILGVNKSTISTILIRHGKRKHSIKDITTDRTEMANLINSGHSNTEIAKIMKCHQSIVCRYRKKLTLDAT